MYEYGLLTDEDAGHSLAFVAGTGLVSTCGHSARVLKSGGSFPLQLIEKVLYHRVRL